MWIGQKCGQLTASEESFQQPETHLLTAVTSEVRS